MMNAGRHYCHAGGMPAPQILAIHPEPDICPFTWKNQYKPQLEKFTNFIPT